MQNNQSSGQTQPSTPVNNNTGNGNSGNTTQPTQPSKPLDDTIPAGAFRTEAEATAYGESMTSGWDSKYDRYSVLGQTTEAGTWYYIVTLYQ